jgi:hypothetical protein
MNRTLPEKTGSVKSNIADQEARNMVGDQNSLDDAHGDGLTPEECASEIIFHETTP